MEQSKATGFVRLHKVLLQAAVRVRLGGMKLCVLVRPNPIGGIQSELFEREQELTCILTSLVYELFSIKFLIILKTKAYFFI